MELPTEPYGSNCCAKRMVEPALVIPWLWDLPLVIRDIEDGEVKRIELRLPHIGYCWRARVDR